MWCAICYYYPLQPIAELSKVRRGASVEQLKQQEIHKNWYAAFTKPRSEDTAKYYLEHKGIEVFYPRLLLPLSSRSGRLVVPLFPNYLFVRIDLDSPEYSQVVWCRGVKRFVSFGGMPSAIEDNIVDFLRDQADPGGLIAAKSNLKVGAEVQIAKGPFKGLAGIIQEPPDTKSRVKVLMSILSRQVQVDVPANYIDIGWVAPCPVG